MNRFEAIRGDSPAEEAARIAIVALHGVFADAMPPEWFGPYTVRGHPEPFLQPADAVEYLSLHPSKPVRITGRWSAGTLELDIEAFGDRITVDGESELDDWKSFQRESAGSLTLGLGAPDSVTVRVAGGNAETVVTIRGIEEFFVTYDIMNEHAVMHDQKTNGAEEPLRFRRLRFAPQRGRSTVQLVDGS